MRVRDINMKKMISALLIFIMLSFCGCSATDQKTLESTHSTTETPVIETVQQQGIVLPKANLITMNWDASFQKAIEKNEIGFTITEKFSQNYFGAKSLYNADKQEIDITEILIDKKTYKEIPLIYPDGFPSWQVGSGSYIILKNRYLYEWRSYTSQFEEDNGHDMKLTRIDCSTGKVEVMDEFQLNSPLIYLCKMDEERFLSYYVVKAPSEKNEYATLTVATIYNLDGTKKEIIREKYENDVDWTDSEGTLIERFAVKDGEIYG